MRYIPATGVTLVAIATIASWFGASDAASRPALGLEGRCGDVEPPAPVAAPRPATYLPALEATLRELEIRERFEPSFDPTDGTRAPAFVRRLMAGAVSIAIEPDRGPASAASSARAIEASLHDATSPSFRTDWELLGVDPERATYRVRVVGEAALAAGSLRALVVAWFAAGFEIHEGRPAATRRELRLIAAIDPVLGGEITLPLGPTGTQPPVRVLFLIEYPDGGARSALEVPEFVMPGAPAVAASFQAAASPGTIPEPPTCVQDALGIPVRPRVPAGDPERLDPVATGGTEIVAIQDPWIAGESFAGARVVAHRIGTGMTRTIGYGTDFSADGDLVAIESREEDEGADRNGDGDLEDSIVRWQRLSNGESSPPVVGSGPVVRDPWIAFSTWEGDIGEDLDGDGLLESSVIRVADGRSGEVFNTGASGFEPRLGTNAVFFHRIRSWNWPFLDVGVGWTALPGATEVPPGVHLGSGSVNASWWFLWFRTALQVDGDVAFYPWWPRSWEPPRAFWARADRDQDVEILGVASGAIDDPSIAYTRSGDARIVLLDTRTTASRELPVHGRVRFLQNPLLYFEAFSGGGAGALPESFDLAANRLRPVGHHRVALDDAGPTGVAASWRDDAVPDACYSHAAFWLEVQSADEPRMGRTGIAGNYLAPPGAGDGLVAAVEGEWEARRDLDPRAGPGAYYFLAYYLERCTTWSDLERFVELAASTDPDAKSRLTRWVERLHRLADEGRFDLASGAFCDLRRRFASPSDSGLAPRSADLLGACVSSLGLALGLLPSEGACGLPDNCPATANPMQDDLDHDGIGGTCDVCPDDFDPSQSDLDHDGIGDACDLCPSVPGSASDPEHDGIGGMCDVCPTRFDPFQGDGDRDGVGDACDNCPGTASSDVTDTDADGLGNVCDDDDDADGVPDREDPCPLSRFDGDGDGFADRCDNCPYRRNADQANADGDPFGDACDPCPDDPSADLNDLDRDGTPDACDADDDGDGILDAEDPCPLSRTDDTDADGSCDDADNCPFVPNPDQSNRDRDRFGDACDGCPDRSDAWSSDDDRDGVWTACDVCPRIADPDQSDADTDGLGDPCDNCPVDWNPSQADVDRDGRGDACDALPLDP